MSTQTLEDIRAMLTTHGIPMVEGDEVGVMRAKKLARKYDLGQPSFGRSNTHDFWVYGGQIYAEPRATARR